MSFLSDLTSGIGLTSDFHADAYKVNPDDITSKYQNEYAQQLQAGMGQAPGTVDNVTGQTYRAPILGPAQGVQGVMGPNQLALQQADQMRAAQMGLISQQQNVAHGGQSVAQAQLMASQNQNQMALLSAAASQRGDVNPALTQRTLLNAAAEQQQQTGQQYAALRAGEMTAAQQGLGNTLSGVYAQDMGVAGQNAALQQANAGIQNQTNQYNASNQNQFALNNAQMQQGAGQYNAGSMQQAAIANQAAQQRQQQLNNEYHMAMLTQFGALNSGTAGNLLQAQQINSGASQNANALNSATAQSAASFGQKLLGGALMQGGSAAGSAVAGIPPAAAAAA